jgi:hypothetical protein
VLVEKAAGRGGRGGAGREGELRRRYSTSTYSIERVQYSSSRVLHSSRWPALLPAEEGGKAAGR